MEPTIEAGATILVDEAAYRGTISPSKSDIILFYPGGGDGTAAIVKRVVAVGGETIEIRANVLHINGVAVVEPYVGTEVQMADFGPEVVPEGTVFLLGDNRRRGASNDSRSFGPVEESLIGGRVVDIANPSDSGE